MSKLTLLPPLYGFGQKLTVEIYEVSGRNDSALWLVLDLAQKDQAHHSVFPWWKRDRMQEFLERNNRILKLSSNTQNLDLTLTLSFRDLRDWEDQELIQKIQTAVQKFLDEVPV